MLKASHTVTAVLNVFEHNDNVNFAFTPVTPQYIINAISIFSSSENNAA